MYGKVIGPIIDAKLEAKAQELVQRYADSQRRMFDVLCGDTADRKQFLVSREEAAEMLSTSLSTIKRMEASGKQLEPVMFGERIVRHRLIDIEALARVRLRV